MRKSILALSMLTLVFVSCKKDKDENTAITPTKENLTGTYMLSKATMYSGTSPEQDVTSQLEACSVDDLHKLNADNSYVIVDAGATCGNDWTDSWALTDATNIVIDGSAYKIRRFDGNMLEMTEDLGGVTYVTYWDKQ